MATIIQFPTGTRAAPASKHQGVAYRAAQPETIVDLSRYRRVTDERWIATVGDFNLLLCLD